MIDLKLEDNEGILLQTTSASRYNENNEFDIDELYLTNKNIIVVYDNSSGIFSKSEMAVDKIPLTSIRIVNEVPQVSQVNDNDYGKVLQIIYTNGKRELFELYDSPKKEYPKWETAISEAVLRINGKIVENVNTVSSNLNDNDNNNNKLDVSAVKSTISNASTKIASNIKEKIISLQNKNVDSGQKLFCSYCGTQLEKNAKFCMNCGKPTEKITTYNSENIEEKQAVSVNIKNEQSNSEKFIPRTYTERQTVYEGNIHKCPNCGEILKSFVTNCPCCGHEIRGNSSVQEFASKLEQIESQREKKRTSFRQALLGNNITKTDEQKINLIRSFSIPNTKEDIFEFMILASSNIDMHIYGLGDKGIMTETQRAVSDAWLAKFEQAYEKAKLSFEATPEFINIKNIYEKKMKELKKKKRELPTLLISTYGGLILFIIIIIICIILFPNNQNTNMNQTNTLLDEEKSNSNEITSETQNTKINNLDTSDFNEEDVKSKLKVTQYRYEDIGNYTIFIIDNPTEYNLSINVEVKFYNKDGKLVGAKDGTITAVEKKTQTFIYFSSEDYDKLDYNLTVTEEKEYNCVISALSYESVKASDKEIVSLTNNGNLDAYVKGYAVFFKDGKIVDFTYEYFTDDNGIIKPQKTITKEMDCYEEYDTVQFYFLGYAMK